MSGAHFAVQSVGEIMRRGRVIIGDVVDGSVKAGMWVSLPGDKDHGAWRVAAVEFADNPSRNESHVALVLVDAPPLQQLRHLLPPGTKVVVANGPSQ